MAVEFCPTCKPNTKKKCASCPRARGKDPVEWMYERGLVEGGTTERHYPTIRFMGIDYVRPDESEEEHY